MSASTHIRIPCPKCQELLKARREYVGKNVSCKRCGSIFTIHLPDEDALVAHAPSSAAVEGVGSREIDASGLSVPSQGHDATPLQTDAALHAERDRLKAELDEALARQALCDPWELDALKAQLEEVRTERDRLREELQLVRSEMAAHQEGAERLGRTVEEFEAIRAERDRLAAECRKTADEAQRLGAEADARHQDSLAALTRELEQARARGEAERLTAQEEWDRQRQALVEDSERRLGEEQARAAVELWEVQEGLDAARHQLERERESLQQELERLRHDHEGVKQERDASSRQVQALAQERDRLSSERDEIRHARLEADQAHRAEVARLSDQEEQSRREAESASRRVDALNDQIRALQAELDRHQQEREAERQEHQQALSRLQQDVEARIAEAAAERDRAAETVEAEHARESAHLQDQLQAATERAERLEAELADVRRRFQELTGALHESEGKGEEIRSLNEQRLARLQDQLQAATDHTGRLEAELTDARRRIGDLTEALHESRAEVNEIRSLLRNVGIHLP